MLNHLYLGTDGNGLTVRTILFEYRKAFDFIDHEIPINKVCRLNIPWSIINWITDFLSNRIQRGSNYLKTVILSGDQSLRVCHREQSWGLDCSS